MATRPHLVQPTITVPEDTTNTPTRPDTGPVRYLRQVEIKPKWLTTAEVAVMLGYGITKTKMLIISGDLKSLKDGRSRRILPEWVDEYIARRVAEAQEAA